MHRFMMESLFPKIKPKESQRYAQPLKTICAIGCPTQPEFVREPVHSSSIILSEGGEKRINKREINCFFFGSTNKHACSVEHFMYRDEEAGFFFRLLKSHLKLQ
jgi:hypothetical protein